MLINKNSQLTPGSIYVFKMTSGEELIARVREITDATIEVSMPLSLFITPQQQMGMQPSMFSIDPDKNVALYKTAIAMSAPPVQEIADNYEKQTSGLAFA